MIKPFCRFLGQISNELCSGGQKLPSFLECGEKHDILLHCLHTRKAAVHVVVVLGGV